MEGKIDIKSTLSSRVSLLKGKPKSMIEDVIKGIKYNQGSNTLIKTLNNNKFNTVPQIFIGEDHIGGYNELLNILRPRFDF